MSIRVMSWVFDHSTVEHRGDLLVLLVLADHAHDDGAGAYPSVETIAQKARLTGRGVQLALKRLVAGGSIVATGKKGPRGTIEYRVLADEPPKSLRGRSDFGGEVSDAQGAKSATTDALSTSPEPSVKPSLEPSTPSSLRSASTGGSEDIGTARELFAYWQQQCGHAAAKPTPERLKKVQARLREGYTVEQIRKAIDGAARAAFVNDAGTRFDDLGLICRNGSKLESFIGRAAGGAHGRPPTSAEVVAAFAKSRASRTEAGR